MQWGCKHKVKVNTWKKKHNHDFGFFNRECSFMYNLFTFQRCIFYHENVLKKNLARTTFLCLAQYHNHHFVNDQEMWLS